MIILDINMKDLKSYRDIHGREIYRISNSFYIKEGDNMKPVPIFLENWFLYFIKNNDNKLIWEIYKTELVKL